MAQIFALQGKSNSGKTDTLVRLLQAIQAKYPTATVQIFHGAGATDIKVILTGVNGMTIGIESQGDPNSRLRQSLADFLAANCDIVFCACRTSGMTVSWINALSPPHIVQFVSQTRTTQNHAATNSAMAANLMQLAGI